jgi:hypothetical protein
VFVSAWRFYNTGLALALAPFVLAAVAKACRRAAAGASLRRATAEIALWSALVVLAGEPVVALLSAVAVVVRLASHVAGDDGGAPAPMRSAGAIAAAAVLAALLSAPQLAATGQSYPGSTRDVAPFSFAVASGTSVHPARLLEQAVPFPHGRPDLTGPLGFHGHARHDNHSPYLWTLHLGWAVLLLLARHGRPLARGERLWWLAAAVAIVLSLGYRLPAARLLSEVLSLGGRVRFPVKWWYLVALCLVVPVARAAGRWLDHEGDRGRAAAPLALFAALGIALGWSDLRTPWALATLAVSGGAAFLVAFGRRRTATLPAAIAVSLACAHLPLALAFVDRPPPPPPPLAGGRVYERLRVDAHPPGGGEPGRTRDVFRRATRELWAVAGGIGGIGYAFDRDPDGSYYDGDREARKAADDLPWPERADALRRAGVRFVVVDEPLPPPFRASGRLGSALLFALDDPAPAVRATAEARITVARERPGRLEATIDTAEPATLVWSRTFFPAWRATVDGGAAAPVAVDGHLIGVAVPAGTHRVEVWWPAGPVAAGALLALIGAAVAATMAWGRTRG